MVRSEYTSCGRDFSIWFEALITYVDVPPKAISAFRARVWRYYDTHRRIMPWRQQPTFYNVLVSELMLQQTQVSRVIPKFIAFKRRFPDVATLANASLAEVLIVWQGLGYNRRAKFLHQAAQIIQTEGEPKTYDALVALPGIGANTAGAILAYAYNQPAVFVETNIRTVFIHEFFSTQSDIDDKDIKELVRRTLDDKRPREWYWALMDYGADLKSRSFGYLAKSRGYKKQSKFEGSLRQARGMILRSLIAGPQKIAYIRRGMDERFDKACQGLLDDGLVETDGKVICLTAYDKTS